MFPSHGTLPGWDANGPRALRHAMVRGDRGDRLKSKTGGAGRLAEKKNSNSSTVLTVTLLIPVLVLALVLVLVLE